MPGQLWASGPFGGVWSNQELSMSLHIQAQPIMRFVQFCDVDPAFGANRGDTLLFDKYLNVQTQGGRLSETAPFPKTGFPTLQSSLKVYELGNSIPYTEKLERLAKLDPRDAHNRAIVNDMAKALDYEAYLEFSGTLVKYTPTGTAISPTSSWSINGTAGATATRNCAAWDLIELAEYMNAGYAGTTQISPVPPFDDDGNYICLCSPGFASAIRRDDDFINASLFGDPSRLFAGEIGRFHGFRIVQTNNLLSRFLGTTGFKGEALVFGAEAVKRAVVVPAEIRRGVPLDGGRDRSFYWYAIEGYKRIWSINATAGDTYEPENRIFHITSL